MHQKNCQIPGELARLVMNKKPSVAVNVEIKLLLLNRNFIGNINGVNAVSFMGFVKFYIQHRHRPGESSSGMRIYVDQCT